MVVSGLTLLFSKHLSCLNYFKYQYFAYLFSLFQLTYSEQLFLEQLAVSFQKATCSIKNTVILIMCNSKNIYTSPMEGISLRPPPLWKFQLSFIHFFEYFGLTEPPTLQEIPIPSMGGVWIFSGTTEYVIVHGIETCFKAYDY